MTSRNGEVVAVELAGRDFVLRRIPMARVRQLNSAIASMVTDVTSVEVDKADGAKVMLDKLLGFPYELLSLFIKDLPREIFEDEENGVTFPEFLDALKAAVELNRLDTLKNFLAPLVPMLVNQGSISAKAN